MSFDIYQTITDKIITMIESGVIPWNSPIMRKSLSRSPMSLNTKRAYSGVNVFLLAYSAFSAGYSSQYWTTYNQALELGGNVRKGERSTMVVFWKQLDTTDKTTGEKKKIPFLRYFNVFNVDQCEGIKAPDLVDYKPLEFNPIERAELIASAYKNCPPIEYHGTRAYYSYESDKIVLPARTDFVSADRYYATLFHEMAHSTGHSIRLNRAIKNKFGSGEYAKEELIAEMTSAFLCARSGLELGTIEQSAGYVQSWLQALKNDKKLVVSAASAAQRAADYIAGPVESPTESSAGADELASAD